MGINLLGSRNSRRVFRRVLNIIMVAIVMLALSSCKGPTHYAAPLLQEGDDLNGMALTTGVFDAPPLTAFCQLEDDEELNTTFDCQVPPLPKLAIGQMIGPLGRALQQQDWSKMDWQIYLDGYLLDLDSFGEYSYAEPVILPAPSSIREAFQQRKTWDIVLVNPTFGLHTLDCTVKTNSVVYNWVVNFMVNAAREPVNMVDRLPVRAPVADPWEADQRDRLDPVLSFPG